jgi:hypothetical protein
MKRLPETENPPVIRTDFSNQEMWEEICSTICQPSDFFSANVEFIDDKEYEGLSIDELRNLIPEDYIHAFMGVVDQTAINNPEHPLLVVNLPEGGELRVIPTQIAAIENNLSTANMDFEEFADAAAEDGIFRGFDRT